MKKKIIPFSASMRWRQSPETKRKILTHCRIYFASSASLLLLLQQHHLHVLILKGNTKIPTKQQTRSAKYVVLCSYFIYTAILMLICFIMSRMVMFQCTDLVLNLPVVFTGAASQTFTTSFRIVPLPKFPDLFYFQYDAQ